MGKGEHPPSVGVGWGAASPAPSVNGFVFDLDGTLVDSRLDFDALRREMGLAEGTSVLEALGQMSPDRAARCRAILERHEMEGAERALCLPGVRQFLDRLAALGVRRAVVTRNSRPMASLMLVRCDLAVDLLIAREDGPVKPDPWAIRHICARWRIAPANVVVIGDFRFDIEAGRRAGCRTIFFTRGRLPETLPGADQADYLLDSFEFADTLLARLGLPLQGDSQET